MDESLNQSENDAESQKLLYKYQYAFLHMQKSFTSLFKIIRLYEEKVSFRYLVRWKSQAFNQVFKLKFFMFLQKLKSCESKLRNHFRLSLQKTFYQLINTANYLQYLAVLRNQFKKVQESNTRELNLMEKEMINLKRSQIELENMTKGYTRREIGYKMKMDHFGSKTQLEKLKNENKQLKNDLSDIDTRTFSFFKDLGLIMDELEEMKKRKIRKLKKKTKVVIKSKPVFVGQA